MLPITPLLPDIRSTLAGHRRAVLVAPPGAGKTTAVPLALLDAPWLAGQRIVMLEPRRLATRAAAHRMATTLGERVGETVGYRIRLDTRVGPRTRIEVVTEGVLTRMIQDDPALTGTGLVIFDEFHERSLVADTGLALTLATCELLRPDLRVLVMSATLDGAAVASLLGDAPLLTSEARAFPVVDAAPAAGSGPVDRAARRPRGARYPVGGERLDPGLPPGRRRDPPRRRPAGGRAVAAGDDGPSALRGVVDGGAGRRNRPGTGRRSQGGAGDEHRRDVVDDRRHSGRHRLRVDAHPALLAPHRDDPPRDGAGDAGIGRPAPWPRRARGTGNVHPLLEHGG